MSPADLNIQYESLYMNMVRWKIKHLGDDRYVAYYVLGMAQRCVTDQVSVFWPESP